MFILMLDYCYISERLMYNKNYYLKTKESSIYASDKVCTKKNKSHLY